MAQKPRSLPDPQSIILSLLLLLLGTLSGWFGCGLIVFPWRRKWRCWCCWCCRVLLDRANWAGKRVGGDGGIGAFCCWTVGVGPGKLGTMGCCCCAGLWACWSGCCWIWVGCGCSGMLPIGRMLGTRLLFTLNGCWGWKAVDGVKPLATEANCGCCCWTDKAWKAGSLGCEIWSGCCCCCCGGGGTMNWPGCCCCCCCWMNVGAPIGCGCWNCCNGAPVSNVQ